MPSLGPLPAALAGVLCVLIVACAGGDGQVTPPPPPPPAVATVRLSQDTATLVPAATVQLAATALDAIGTVLNRTITWVSSDETKARVSATGLVSGVALGTASITASADGRSAQVRVTVKDGAIVGATGATITGLGGVVSLDVPAGALPANTMITVDNAVGAPSDPRLVAGTAIELAAGGAVITQPISLRLKYRSEQLPPGPPERLLRLHRVEAAAWQAAASTVDLPNKTVGGGITALGTYGILAPAAVASVVLSQTAVQLRSGDSLTLTATPRDAAGATLADRDVSWSSSDVSVASVGATSGVVTAVAAGSATITATIEGKIASAVASVAEPVASVEVAATNVSVQVWGSLQLSVTLRDRRNNVLTGRVVAWSSSDTGVATIDPAGVVSGISPGKITATVTSEGIGATATVTVPPLPDVQIASVSPGILTRGVTATITGANFGRRLTDNVVTVAGVTTTVTRTAPTQLTVTLPQFGFQCQTTKDVEVGVVRGFSETARRQHPLSVSKVRLLQLGESMLLTGATELACNEINFTGGQHYLLSIVNANRSAASLAGFDLFGLPEGGTLAAARRVLPEQVLVEQSPTRVRPSAVAARASAANVAAQQHDQMLEQSQRIVRRLGSPIASWRSAALRNLQLGEATRSDISTTVGAMNTLRYPAITGSDPCNTFTTVTARTAVVSQRAVILEDVTAPLAGTLDTYYQQIAQQFDATMFPIITSYFGNPLALDAQLDNNGRIAMLFTPRVNQVNGLAGFVIACDFYHESVAPSSNRTELLYALVPSTASGTSSSSAAGWFWDVRSTIIHEVKHLTMYAERFSRAGSGPVNLEQLWLEEGTARHAEELWARSYSGAMWKGNTIYDVGVRCDFHLTDPACANKGAAMSNHFAAMYDYLFFQGERSPLGRTTLGDFSFYGSAWSLVRWAMDHYATSEQAFLSALVQDATRSGVENLEARTGKPLAEMLARWSVANWADDRSGITITDPTLLFPSWQTRNVYAGLAADIPSFFPFASPLISFQPAQEPWLIRTLVNGGSSVFVRVQGTETVRQMIELRGYLGAVLSPSFYVMLVRVQ